MELDPKFTFVHLDQINLPNIYDKSTQELLSKWGLQDNLSFQQFSFNESFQGYNKYHLVESFFNDETVIQTLKTKKNFDWVIEGKHAQKVEAKHVPCTVTNMSFFDKLKNPENNIVWSSGLLHNTYYNEIDGFIIANNLQALLLDEESENYNLYEPNEKDEFIFQILQLLVLGGTLCQYDDELKSYLETTKKIYKDLIRVQKQEEKLVIKTLVFQVVAKDSENTSYFPCNSEHRQNIAFLCINPQNRLVTTFLSQCN